jgi:anti-sigma regulatory factor (Ser/Thr protein kinase)
MNDPCAPIELRILSQPRLLCVARAAVGSAVERLGFPPDACAHIMLALDEAVTNVMRHGYQGRADGPIWISFIPLEKNAGAAPDANRFCCGGFRIVIEDEARQVDPGSIQGRDLEDVRPGGLGVHIIRKIMDQVEYSPRPAGGMRLVMTKFLPSATTVAHSSHGGPNS